MSFNRYADIRIQPVVPEFTIQETTMVPLMKQKRRDDMWDKLSQMDTDVNRTSQDDPFIKQDIEGFTGRRGEIVDRMTKNPFDPTLSKDLYTLGADIKSWKTTGRGFNAQQAYNKFSTAKPTYLEQGLKAGHSLEETEANWAVIEKDLKESGKWGAFNPETGEGLDYQTALIYDIPKAEEQHEYLGKVFKEVTGHLRNANGETRISNYQGMLKLTDKTGLTDDNVAAINGALAIVNADANNPNSTIRRSMDFKKQDKESLLKLAEGYAAMKAVDIEENNTQIRLHNPPKVEGQDPTIQQSAIRKIESGRQVNPWDPSNPSFQGLTDEEKLTKYYDAVGLTPEQRSKIPAAGSEFWNKLTSPFKVLQSLTKLAYHKYKPVDEDYVKSGEYLKNPYDYETRIAIQAAEDELYGALYEGYTGENYDKFKEEIKAQTGVDISKIDKRKAEFPKLIEVKDDVELDKVIDNLSIYYGDAKTGGYTKDQLKRMYQTNRPTFNSLILQEENARATVQNSTYWDFGYDVDSKRARDMQQEKYTNKTFDSTGWFTLSGQPVKFEDINENDDKQKFELSGWAGAGNPTTYAYADRVTVRNTDGSTNTYYKINGQAVSPQETAVHDAYRIASGPLNYGEFPKQLLDFYPNPDGSPLPSKIGFHRTQLGYKIYTDSPDGSTREWVQDSEGDIMYFTEPMEFLSVFLQ